MAKRNRKNITPEQTMRMRFTGISVLIICLNLFFIDNPKIQILSLLLIVTAHLFFTLSGRVLIGTWTNKEKWRNTNAPQKTFMFRFYIGFPLSLIFFALYFTGYQVQLGQMLMDVIFPPDAVIEPKMEVVRVFLQAKMHQVVGALLFYSALAVAIGTIVKSIQLSYSSRILRKLKRTADAKRIIAQMSWDQFEKVVCKFFETKGYKSRVTPPGADGGVDIDLVGNGRREMVQCKHWKTNRVGISVVREIYAVVLADHYYRGFIITSGSFSQEAWNFSQRDGIKGKVILLDGSQLVEIIKGKENISDHEDAPNSEPLCPVCGDKMFVRRTPKNTFYGCRQYPDCRGTREY